MDVKVQRPRSDSRVLHNATIKQKQSREDEMLTAAQLLLSVSPLFKPTPQRDRSWSVNSLDTLVDVATSMQLPPNANGYLNRHGMLKKQTGTTRVARKKISNVPVKVKGRSLLQGKPSSTSSSSSSVYSVLKTGVVRSRKDGTPLIRPASNKTLIRPVSKTLVRPVYKARVRGVIHEAKIGVKSKYAKSGQHIFPSVLSLKYRGIYFQDGRVGIYTRSQRDARIKKFLEKRGRRVWGKKVRYSCRKNLAQQRIRIKGRFVKTDKPLKAQVETPKPK